MFASLAEDCQSGDSRAVSVQSRQRREKPAPPSIVPVPADNMSHDIIFPNSGNELLLRSTSSSSDLFESDSIQSKQFMEGGSATRPFVATHALDYSGVRKNRRRKRDVAARLLRPYVEKGIMSGIIYMLGEAISCGLFVRQGKSGFYPDAFIRYSVLHSTMIGMFANGPLLHIFFELVDRFVRFESKVLNIIMKVVVDQIVWGCLWNFSYILLMNLATDSPGFGYVGEGLGMDFVLDLCKGFNSAFWKAIDWRLHAQLLSEGLKMLPMDIICYWLVPLPLRALWVASVDVFWVTILSQYD